MVHFPELDVVGSRRGLPTPFRAAAQVNRNFLERRDEKTIGPLANQKHASDQHTDGEGWSALPASQRPQRVPCSAATNVVDSCHEGSDTVPFSALPTTRRSGGKLGLNHPTLVGLLWDNRIKIGQTGRNSSKGACTTTPLRINSLQYRREPSQTTAN